MVTSAAWSPKDLLVTGDEHGEVFASRGGSAAGSTLSVQGSVSFIQFSPDGNVVGIAAGRTLELRDASNLQLLARLTQGTDMVTFAFDARGERVVSGSLEGIARVWRTRDGTRLASLSGGPEVVQWMQFVSDQLVVATGSDGALHFWDVDRAKKILLLPGSRVFATNVLATDAYTYLLQSTDGSIITWDLPRTPW